MTMYNKAKTKFSSSKGFVLLSSLYFEDMFWNIKFFKGSKQMIVQLLTKTVKIVQPSKNKVVSRIKI
jgi:hypothetical protein